MTEMSSFEDREVGLDCNDHDNAWLCRLERMRDPLGGVSFTRESERPSEDHKAESSLDDAWQEQIEQFITEEQVQVLVQLLRTSELRETLAGVLSDCMNACRDKNLLELAEILNGWIATAEEMAGSRRKLRHILNAREAIPKNQ